MSICSVCGKMESVTKGLIIDGEFVCSEHVRVCEECGERFSIEHDDEACKVDGVWVCGDCLNNSDNYFRCEHCEELHHVDDERIVHGRYEGELWCSDCASDDAFYCDQCEEWYSNNYYTEYETTDGESICGECLNNGEWVLCYECERATQDWEEGDDGEYYCSNCIDDHKDDNPIHKYGWNPDNDGNGYKFYDNFVNDINPKLSDFKNKKRYIGVELEAEGDESEASAYLEHFKNGEDIIFLTHDSSIENGGFEITSHPMSFDYMYNSPFTTELKNSFEFLDKKGFKSHNRGGLHVHVSSDDISSTQLGVMACILYNYRNSDNYRKILGITQRKMEKIEHWASVTMPADYTKEEFFNNVVYQNRISYDRYNGLNVTSRTIEFRVFNGNLRFERFLKNIEFVEACLDYSEIIADEIKTLNADGFPLDAYLNKYADINALINYINETAEKYANLKAFLIEKGIKADEIMADAVLTDTQNNA